MHTKAIAGEICFLHKSECSRDVTGAKKAGVKILCVWDRDEVALINLEANHPEVVIYRMDQQAALEFLKDYRNVDILHISWPCQFFSVAHTVPGQHDDTNSAAILDDVEERQ